MLARARQSRSMTPARDSSVRLTTSTQTGNARVSHMLTSAAMISVTAVTYVVSTSQRAIKPVW